MSSSANLPSTRELMDRLYGSFDAIFRAWQANPPKETHLWELTQYKTTLNILEQDVIDIGHFFSAADSIGARCETYLIAELIAQLRANHGKPASKRKAEAFIDEIGEWLMSHSGIASQQSEKVYAPLCYRLSQLAVARDIAHPDTFGVLRRTLIDLAYHFLLRDGNVTLQEDERMKEFHAALS